MFLSTYAVSFRFNYILMFLKLSYYPSFTVVKIGTKLKTELKIKLNMVPAF